MWRSSRSDSGMRLAGGCAPGRITGAQQPELLLLADMRKIPDERTHERVVLGDQDRLVQIGERQCAVTCLQKAANDIVTHVPTDLPPVPRTPDLRWPVATGKDVRHARTPPPGVPAARGRARS
jgi:hypothetical protein